jgi:hypothetical protein
MKSVARYAALAMAVLSGITFPSGSSRYLEAYYTYHRLTPLAFGPFYTLFTGVGCLGFGRVYYLLGRRKSDTISKVQTEIELVHIALLGSWFCFLFMLHTMNPRVRSVAVWVVAAFISACVYVFVFGFVTRKKIFRRSAEALPGDLPNALKFWKLAHIIGFGYAMNLALSGFALKFLGSNWLVPGILFGLSLGFLLLWRPRQIASIGGAQPV